MTNYSTGHDAEKDASIYLEELGFKILALNWKTRFCEIDIVAQKGKSIYFVEVKYRNSDRYGDGFSYITPKKLKQMNFAARMWISDQKWDGDCTLAAIAASPAGFDFIEIN